jgi:hypothetical protein
LKAYTSNCYESQFFKKNTIVYTYTQFFLKVKNGYFVKLCY